MGKRSLTGQAAIIGIGNTGFSKQSGYIEMHMAGGRLPINTHGGQLGEAYVHGMNGVAERVRQIRGQSFNQVNAVEQVLVTAGTGMPTSGLILGVSNYYVE